MPTPPPLPPDQPFRWPEGIRAAVSLTFDDARTCQIDRGGPILDSHGIKGTFYVTLNTMMRRLDNWRALATAGHEIGNHSTTHPCSGNFQWSRGSALENFTLHTMALDIDAASKSLNEIFGQRPRTFAYPCGQTFVGRGADQKSYVPLIADRFLVGRGFNNEAPNDPGFCDLAYAAGIDMDCKRLDAVMNHVRGAQETGTWLILAGHAVGDKAPQTVRADVLDAVCRFCADKSNGIWIDTVENIGAYISAARPVAAAAMNRR